MAIQTGAGKKLYIATVAGTVPATSGAYIALTWRECEQTEALGDLGDTSAEVTFTGLGDGRVQKLKGAKDAGTLNVTMALNDEILSASPSGGQELLLLASADTSTNNYRFKRVLTGVTEYFSGKVGSFVIGVSGANNVVMANSEIRVNSDIIYV